MDSTAQHRTGRYGTVGSLRVPIRKQEARLDTKRFVINRRNVWRSADSFQHAISYLTTPVQSWRVAGLSRGLYKEEREKRGRLACLLQLVGYLGDVVRPTPSRFWHVVCRRTSEARSNINVQSESSISLCVAILNETRGRDFISRSMEKMNELDWPLSSIEPAGWSVIGPKAHVWVDKEH